jgi:hypothetical protein
MRMLSVVSLASQAVVMRLILRLTCGICIIACSTDIDMALYPEIEPFDHGMLVVSKIHTIYFEQCGNPQGQPVVFCHGR